VGHQARLPPQGDHACSTTQIKSLVRFIFRKKKEKTLYFAAILVSLGLLPISCTF
jgi:hypothetical protein